MNWIQTQYGLEFNLLCPDEASISIYDIAHALSNMCRFTGHTKEFYSVAEHSLHVMHAVSRHVMLRDSEHASQILLSALMHDAHEAYTGDVATPIKRVLGKAWYDFERRIERAVARKFSLLKLDCIVDADRAALLCEQEQLLGKQIKDWQVCCKQPLNVRVQCYDPWEAKILFLEAYWRLHGTK